MWCGSVAFRIAGTRSALVKKKRYKLVTGSLLFIARGERHENARSGKSLPWGRK